MFAEIISRYHPDEISLHSFDPAASSVAKKRDNWGQLVKFFKKKSWDIRTREWEQVSAMESGAAQELMDKVFKFLGGTLGTPVVSPDAGARPSENHEAGPSGPSHHLGQVHSHREHQNRAPVQHRAPAPVSYGQQLAQGGAGRQSVMDIMEAGPSVPSADPIHDLFGRYAGEEDEDEDDRGGPPPGGARMMDPYLGVPMEQPSRPGSNRIRNSRGSRKPVASDRRDGGGGGFGGGGFGGGGFQPYQPKAGGFDWDAYQRDFMQPGGGLRTPSPEPEPEPEYEPHYEPDVEPEPSERRGGARRMQPLPPSNHGPAPRVMPRDSPGGRGGGYESQGGYESRGGGYESQGGPGPVRGGGGGFDPNASLLDWGAPLPGDSSYYGGGEGDPYASQYAGYENEAGYDDDQSNPYANDPFGDGNANAGRSPYNDRGGGGSQMMSINHKSDRPRQKRSPAGKKPPVPTKSAMKQRSAYGGGRGDGGYDDTYGYDDGYGDTYGDQNPRGGYQDSYAYRPDRRAGHGVDYEPRRPDDYRRMLGENGKYLMLGSLGVDTDTDEHRKARARAEAIKEFDRLAREQNRIQAEKAKVKKSKQPVVFRERLQQKFDINRSSDKPLDPNAPPSKRDVMLKYGRSVPKPKPAPPREERVVQSVHEHGKGRGYSSRANDFVDYMNHPAVPDESRMLELERLEIEYRIHQEKLAALNIF